MFSFFVYGARHIIPTSRLASTGRNVCFRTRGLASLVKDNGSDNSFRIPIVNFSKFKFAKNDTEKQQTADEVVTAFKEVGFVYLSEHGIPKDTVDNVFKKSAEFFKMPSEVKSRLAWEDPRSNRGYVAQGRERVTQSSDAKEIAALREKAPDFKESMEIGRDWDITWKNQWPQENECPGFKETMLQFFQTCHELHVSVMQSIAIGLNLRETFFDDKIHEQYHNLRLLSYPSVKTGLLRQDGQARAGAHSDYGTLTLLFQDSVGGLEVQNPHTKQFQPALPVPGTIVVNVGDLLSRWSNDTLRSTLHRVVAPQAAADTDVTPQRQSVAFFCNPNGGALIDCIPGCYGPGKEKRYGPVTTEEYIVKRLSDTYV